MKGLKFQKRIASSLLKGSKKRIKFDSDRLEEIKEAITRG
ncbi:MAG: 50S ribosomal protein L19e, partial [Nanoarchaeota archaeon]